MVFQIGQTAVQLHSGSREYALCTEQDPDVLDGIHEIDYVFEGGCGEEPKYDDKDDDEDDLIAWDKDAARDRGEDPDDNMDDYTNYVVMLRRMIGMATPMRMIPTLITVLIVMMRLSTRTLRNKLIIMLTLLHFHLD